MIRRGLQSLLRTAAEALANLSDKAHQWAYDWAGAPGTGPDGSAAEFAGVDFVGIDFSTSIRKLAEPVIRGWDRYRQQRAAFHPDHGVWAFGVNSIPFALTPRPAPLHRLPSLRSEHFEARGHGQGLIEYGSAFYDYFLVALGHARALGVFDEGGRDPAPITLSLLCDGCPNGGVYRAEDVRPLLEEARARGVRFKVAGFARRKYRAAMQQFGQSLGLTQEELEVCWHEEGAPDEVSISSSFDLLSRC